MFSKLKQFKDLRDQGKKMQNAMAGESATARAAGDKVAITLDGNLQMTTINIDPELLAVDKKVKLENAIKNAYTDALKKMQRVMATKMQEMGGLAGLK